MHEQGLLLTREVAEIVGIDPHYLTEMVRRYDTFPRPSLLKSRKYWWAPSSAELINEWIAQNIDRHEPGPPLERFLLKVEWSTVNSYTDENGIATPCLEWTKGQNGAGYGKFWDGERENTPHRWFYELSRGPIPKHDEDGNLLHLDHLCRNRICCWPGHLEVVTLQENTAGRGMNPTVIAYRSKRCLRDLHDMTPQNTRVIRSTGRRKCLACERETTARRAERIKAEIANGTYTGKHGQTAYSYGCKCDVCRTAENGRPRIFRIATIGLDYAASC
jgi:predicted DNA-binding transcriptional regulator AlpA